MVGIIYKATNTINGKVYIGQTKQDFESRKRYHYFYMNQGVDFVFYRALRKYGWDNFHWEIIDTANSEDELDNKEIFWISHLKSYIYDENSNGYNMTLGGEGARGRVVSDETRKKLSKAKKGENNPLFGKNLSEEHRRKISDGNKGKNVSEETRIKMSKSQMGDSHWNRGKNLSDEHKKKIAESISGENHPMFGKKHRKESIEAMRFAKIGRKNQNGRDRAVVKLDAKTNLFIKEYNSLNDAKDDIGVKSSSNISACCTGKRKTAHGFKWMYKDDYIELEGVERCLI